MGEINSHRDLLAWQFSMDLVVAVYEMTSQWPRDEIYGLTSQIRRAAVSVPANIAEGYGRDNRGSYIHFLKIAQGSLKEVETHIEVALRIGLIHQELCDVRISDAGKIGRVLRALIRSLEATE